MVGIVIAYVVFAGVGGLLVWGGLTLAKQGRDFGRIAIATTVLTIILFITSIFAFVRRDTNASISTLPLLTSLSEVKDALGRQHILVSARVSEENDLDFFTDYAAYVRTEKTVSDADIGYYLPDLTLRLSDTNIFRVDQQIYEPLDWNTADDGSYEYDYLVPGDWVLVFGEPYTAQVLFGEERGEQMWVSAEFVYRGTYDDFASDHLPRYERNATIANVLAWVMVVTAGLIFVAPLVGFVRFKMRSL